MSEFIRGIPESVLNKRKVESQKSGIAEINAELANEAAFRKRIFEIAQGNFPKQQQEQEQQQAVERPLTPTQFMLLMLVGLLTGSIGAIAEDELEKAGRNG
jgi:hypothetical protein